MLDGSIGSLCEVAFHAGATAFREWTGSVMKKSFIQRGNHLLSLIL